MKILNIVLAVAVAVMGWNLIALRVIGPRVAEYQAAGGYEYVGRPLIVTPFPTATPTATTEPVPTVRYVAQGDAWLEGGAVPVQVTTDAVAQQAADADLTTRTELLAPAVVKPGTRIVGFEGDMLTVEVDGTQRQLALLQDVARSMTDAEAVVSVSTLADELGLHIYARRSDDGGLLLSFAKAPLPNDPLVGGDETLP